MYMNYFKTIKQLCTPAQIYFAVSFLSIFSMMIQNVSNPHQYCCGDFSANSPISNVFYFVFKIVYVLVWTYILNLLCKKGYNTMSWTLLLLPLIGMFIIIALILISLQRLK